MVGNVENLQLLKEEQILYWKNKSDNCHEAAKVMYNQNYFSESVTLVYYGLVYLSRALFVQDNVHAYKPSTILAALGKEYVIPGKLGASFHRNMLQIFDMRYKSDFETGYEVSPEMAAYLLEQAAELRQELTKLLQQEELEENIS